MRDGTSTTRRAEPFELVAGHVALDFVNTLDVRFDRDRTVERLESYDRVLAFGVQARLLSPAQAARLARRTSRAEAARAHGAAVALREALFGIATGLVQGTGPPPAALPTLNRVLGEAAASRRLVRAADGYAWAPLDVTERPTAPLWPIATAAAELFTSGDRGEIRACESATCRWLFLDRSRNHSRRWCDMATCGNRVKARRYQMRRRGARGVA